MAAASYTTDLIDWIADNDTTAWGELTGKLSGGAPDEADTESALQGTNTVSQATNSTSECTMARLMGTPVTLTTGQVFLVWHGHGVATALTDYANGGLRLYVTGNSLGNYKGWAVGGNDVAPFPYAKWVNNPIDPTITADYTAGTPPTNGTNIQGVGSGCILTQAVAKGQPHVVDMIRYGRAEARINGGDLANGYATFAGFAAQNDSQTNRWGLIQSTTGGYQWKGLMTLGYVSAVDFRDQNLNVFVQDCRKVTSTFNTIEIRQAGSRVDWTNINFINSAPSTNASKGNLVVIDNADVNIDGCSFVDMGTYSFLSNSTIIGSTFRRCGLITQGSSTFTGNLVARPTGTGLLSNDPSIVQNNEFISAGTGHAIEINTPGTYTFSGNIFTGYGANNTTDAAIYNNSGGAVTLNISGGGTVPTVRNGTNASTTVNASVNLTFDGLQAGSEVRVYLGTNPSTSTELGGVESSGTSFTVSHSNGGQQGYYTIVALSYNTIYQPITFSGSDQTIPIVQTVDRTYTNP